ncbi:hypothetical protein [Glutamicibacter arilaitensis]|uniref:hypothetical protein n=1 Tax=Glutamicibacter arilaitensis TaxID=256701 RepID=UPI00384BCE56
MDLLIIWTLAAGLTVIVFYAAWKAQPARSAEHAPGEKGSPRKRITELIASFDMQSWGLFIAAICFLLAALVRTIGAFD